MVAMVNASELTMFAISGEGRASALDEISVGEAFGYDRRSLETWLHGSLRAIGESVGFIDLEAWDWDSAGQPPFGAQVVAAGVPEDIAAPGSNRASFVAVRAGFGRCANADMGELLAEAFAYDVSAALIIAESYTPAQRKALSAVDRAGGIRMIVAELSACRGVDGEPVVRIDIAQNSRDDELRLA